MSGKLIRLKAPLHTLNVDRGDGFLCMLCGHWTWYKETEWAESFYDRAMTGVVGHMHGTEDFHFCPNCGAEILTRDEWVKRRPWDAGKSVEEVFQGLRRERLEEVDG